jgi:hypothetical protein
MNKRGIPHSEVVNYEVNCCLFQLNNTAAYIIPDLIVKILPKFDNLATFILCESISKVDSEPKS